MGRLISGMASSHAFTLMEPSTWDAFRLRNRQSYERRYGDLPAEHVEEMATETVDDVRLRYGRITAALRRLRRILEEQRPEAIVFVADDQNENFTTTIPQFGVYLGESFRTGPSDAGDGATVPGHAALAKAILESSIQGDVDLAAIHAFPDNHLRAHAIGPVLKVIDPGGSIPIVPIFVNAIHEPAPSPARCLYVGDRIRAAIEQCRDIGNVCIYASGGLSHFTAGYPWARYKGDMTHGSIDEKFDRLLIRLMEQRRSTELTRLSANDLLEHGDIEFRTWLVALGALGHVAPDFIEYQAFYRGVMGMGVASWTVPSADGLPLSQAAHAREMESI
jgi:aromatic ring-opening dioxygenase catalytic subunit (LigB family)